ncbi:tyrosine-type recombinase/integrase [Kordiimonas aestuarii]|uniref:tyrosine-type recombinase/integrase n=1 Tax=Kordiimonas aestuarii TaxID=1005925 RepID=UPI0021CDFD92|nr:site-specific integrase [Kordiimonas aestuarii]
MATYRKRGDTWRVEIRKQGHYLSASFSTKARAVEWATLKEAEIMEGKLTKIAGDILVGDAFRRYAEEVSPLKRGMRWEVIRLTSLQKDELAKVPMKFLNTQHMATFRDKRLKEVSPSTVNRELNLMSAVFTKARKEWLWLLKNPIHDLDRPRQPRPRDRLISQGEIDRVILALGYCDHRPVRTKSELVGLFFLLAIESGMRLGEMCSMDSSSVFLEKKYVQLSRTKNGDDRQVPLSPRAIELCQQYLDTYLQVESRVASALFRKAVAKTDIQNLRFHDTRHEAITRLARKLDVLALARVVGHRDIKSLMIYYNESATTLAAKLA